MLLFQTVLEEPFIILENGASTAPEYIGLNIENDALGQYLKHTVLY
jgi:hypothetical protein